jgi:GT2 family glycosyltransferase
LIGSGKTPVRSPSKALRTRPTKLLARLWALARHPFSPARRRACREYLRQAPLAGVDNRWLSLMDGVTPEVPFALLHGPGPAAAPRVSIIVPVHNQLEFTLRCLMAIAAHPSRASVEIVVCDDASQDGTARVLGPVAGIRYIRNAANLGFVLSCNRAAAEARGEFLLFLNNDTQVQEGWLDHMLALFDQDARAGLVGARLVFPDGRLQEAGGTVWRDGSAHNIGRYDDPAKLEFNRVREVDYCSGACLLIRASLFRQLGGFDARYAPAYYEDTDLAFRVRQAGRKVLYQPKAVVVHHEGASGGTDPGAGIEAQLAANRAKFIERWRKQLEESHLPKPD